MKYGHSRVLAMGRRKWLDEGPPPLQKSKPLLHRTTLPAGPHPSRSILDLTLQTNNGQASSAIFLSSSCFLTVSLPVLQPSTSIACHAASHTLLLSMCSETNRNKDASILISTASHPVQPPADQEWENGILQMPSSSPQNFPPFL
ncbi:hypothetical protein LZ31DRAFT_379157 [Colletotrichum somersetense]|nr:hypothetical protein LZ31DRAFT_379157 [Colletotrichum somersetense]